MLFITKCYLIAWGVEKEHTKSKHPNIKKRKDRRIMVT